MHKISSGKGPAQAKARVPGMYCLLACMPKSGSTFLSKAVSELPGMRRVHLVPGYQRREQELDPGILAQQAQNQRYLTQLWKQGQLKQESRPRGWVAQHHVRYHQTTHDLIREWGITPIVLVRNIYDVVPSIYDHLSGQAKFMQEGKSPVGNNQYMSMAYVAEDALTYDRETFLEFIAEMVIPWYFNFYTSWTAAPNATLITYEEMIDNPRATLSKVVELMRNPFSGAEVAAALEAAQSGMTRQNKGHAGRGADLPDSVRRKIESYARFYPGIDFSPIGLGSAEEARAKGLKGIGKKETA